MVFNYSVKSFLIAVACISPLMVNAQTSDLDVVKASPYFERYKPWDDCMRSIASISVANGKNINESLSLALSVCKDKGDLLRAKLIEKLGAIRAEAILNEHEKKYRALIIGLQPKVIENQVAGWIYNKNAEKCTATKINRSPFGDKYIFIQFYNNGDAKLIFVISSGDSFANYKHIVSGARLYFSGNLSNSAQGENYSRKVGFNFIVEPRKSENSVTFVDEDALTDETIKILSQFDRLILTEEPWRISSRPLDFQLSGLREISNHMKKFC